jgi:hypothetical protein
LKSQSVRREIGDVPKGGSEKSTLNSSTIISDGYELFRIDNLLSETFILASRRFRLEI